MEFESRRLGARRRFALSAGAVGLGLLLLGSACGGDDAKPAVTVEPGSAGVATSAVSAPPAQTPAVSPTPAVTPSEEVTNSFGVKLGVVRTIGPGDATKLTLPSTPEKIDKIDISDAFRAGNTVLRLGITDGVVMSPVDGKVSKITRQTSTTVGDTTLVTILLSDARGVTVWGRGDAVVAVKEGDTVTRGAVLLTESARLTAAVGDGYSTIVEYAAGPALGLRLNLNPGAAWVGDRPSSYLH